MQLIRSSSHRNNHSRDDNAQESELVLAKNHALCTSVVRGGESSETFLSGSILYSCMTMTSILTLVSR